MEAQLSGTSSERAAVIRLLLALRSLKGVGTKTLIGCLGEASQNATAVLEGESDAVTRLAIPPAAKRTWLDADGRSNALAHADRELERAGEVGATLLLSSDDDYPAGLKRIPDPPPVLYLRGSLPQQMAVAVVGTRSPTRDGRYTVRRLCAELSVRGWTIVSGLARGLDTVAHETALEFEAKTVAVLAHGLSDDAVYPPENRPLAARILAAGGSLLSEYPIDSGPQRSQFVSRNRLQSGLSVATVVGEAGLESGTMHTARAASEQGRLVFAYAPPRAKDVEQFRGLWKLVDDGTARPLASNKQIPDLVRDLSAKFGELYGRPLPEPSAADAQTIQARLADVERQVLSRENRTLREEIEEAEATASQLRGELDRLRAALKDIGRRAGEAAQEPRQDARAEDE